MSGVSTWFLFHYVKKRKVIFGKDRRIKGRRLVKEGRIKGKGEMELLSTGVEERNKGSGRKKEEGVGKMLGAYNMRLLHCRALFPHH